MVLEALRKLLWSTTKWTGKPVTVGAEDTALLKSFRSLWKLAFKGPPWLVLLYFLEHQALKSHLSGIFLD